MKKFKDLMIILAVYVFSFGFAILATWAMKIESVMLNVFIFDIIATVIVYIFSVLFKNSSVYDPYWSFLPWFVALYLMIRYKAFTFEHIYIFVCFSVWSWRLTINWIKEFTDFSYEDWRYRHFRKKSNGSKFMWFIYNFFGIHLVPTLFVFGGMLPLFYIFKAPYLEWSSTIGGLIILVGAMFEHFADTSLRFFLTHKHEENTTCKIGLWKYSRHPNYLGEITNWFGVFVAMIFCTTTYWYYAIGFIMIFVMFMIISIPLAENRNKGMLVDYEEYMKNTSKLFILPNKKHN